MSSTIQTQVKRKPITSQVYFKLNSSTSSKQFKHKSSTSHTQVKHKSSISQSQAKSESKSSQAQQQQLHKSTTSPNPLGGNPPRTSGGSRGGCPWVPPGRSPPMGSPWRCSWGVGCTRGRQHEQSGFQMHKGIASRAQSKQK